MIEVIEQDGDVYSLRAITRSGEFRILAEFHLFGEVLELSRFHIDGPGPGTTGLAELRRLAREFGRQPSWRLPTLANQITGNQDGSRGENETYRIPGRGSNIPRRTVVREVEAGQHPNHSTYTLNGQTYLRANPDSTTNNNINKD